MCASPLGGEGQSPALADLDDDGLGPDTSGKTQENRSDGSETHVSDKKEGVERLVAVAKIGGLSETDRSSLEDVKHLNRDWFAEYGLRCSWDVISTKGIERTEKRKRKSWSEGAYSDRSSLYPVSMIVHCCEGK